MRVLTWARANGGAAVANTDGRGFDTSRAGSYAPDNQSGHQHFDNCRGIVIGVISTMAPHGSVAPWGAAGGKPAVIPTEGVRFLPGPRRASRLTGGAPALNPDGFEAQGAHAAAGTSRRSSASGSAGPRAGGRGCESRRWRHVDVAQGTKAPAREAGECRFKPCRRHQSQLAVARVDEHRRFSFRVPGLRRRGSHVRIVPATGETQKWEREAIRLDEEPVPKTGAGL